MNKLATAVPLIAGPVIFFLGATVPVVTGLTLEVWFDPIERSLSLIARNLGAWRVTNALLLIAAVITLIGITGLLSDNTWAKAGLVLFSLGALLWIIELTLRLSMTVWAAKDFAETSALAPIVEPFSRWTSVLNYLFMVLTYLGTASVGIDILRAFPSAAWGGWSAIIIGLGSAVLYVLGVPGLWSIPAGAQLGPLLLGIWVLSGL